MTDRPPKAGQDGVLDGAAARLAALGLFVLAGAFLGYLHRDSLLPSDANEAVVSEDPFLAACQAAEAAKIQAMLDEGLLQEAQAKTSRSRIEGYCRDQAARRGN